MSNSGMDISVLRNILSVGISVELFGGVLLLFHFTQHDWIGGSGARSASASAHDVRLYHRR